MNVSTRLSPSATDQATEPIARRRPVRRIAGWLVGLVAAVAITIGIVSDGSTRPGTPKPAPVDGGSPASSLVVPFSVEGSAVTEGISSVDG